MGFLNSAGNFFRGVFNSETDDEKKRRQQQAQLQAAQKPQQPKNVTQLFGAQKQPQIDVAKPQVPFTQPKPVTAVASPVPKPVATPAPTPSPDYEAIKQRAQGYQKPGVQDVNNYYGNDLKVLNDELAKGDKADLHRVNGIMQSLDNRKKELQSFHNERGNTDSFKSARELQDTIKKTRGNWAAENEKLKQFWDSVKNNETADFQNYLTEKNVNDQTSPLNIISHGHWRNGTGTAYGANFSDATQKVKAIKQRQEVADEALKYGDVPLDQLNNHTINDFLATFKAQTPDQQRNTMRTLEKGIIDNEKNFTGDPALQRRMEQAYLVHTVLEDSGAQRGDNITALKNFGEGINKFGAAIVASPERVAQSIGALAGDNPAQDIENDYRDGKLTKEQYNAKMNAYQRSLDWVPKEGDTKAAVLTAAGTAADTVATFLPVGSAVKGAKGAMTLEKLIQEGLQQGLTREAATQVAKDALKTEGKSLAKTVRDEAATNAAFSGAGSLREGQFDPAQMAKEAVIGGTIGAAAPVGGSGVTKLWNRLRNVGSAAPQAAEDIGRITTRLENDAATGAVDDMARAQSELEAFANDLSIPAYERAAAKEQLAKIAEQKARAAADPLDRPAFMHQQDIKNIVETENANLERYINEHPDLTPQQIEAAQQAAKERIIKLTDELKQSRYGAEQAVSEQGAATDATIANQEATNAAVKAEQAAQASPNVTATAANEAPANGSPEVAANDGYRPTTEQVLFGDQPAFEEKGKLSLPQLFSPDRVIRENITRPLENLANRGIEKLQTSGNRVGKGFGRLFNGFSREAGIAPELQTARMQLRGGVETGKLYRENIADLSKGMSKDSTERVWATLDPEFAARRGMTVGELTPEEAVLQDKLKTIIDNTTAENLRRGLITTEQASAGNYIKRSYSVYDGNTEAGKFEQGFRQELMGQYKGRKNVSDAMVEQAITDPTYLVGKKSAESQAMWAMQDYGNHLSSTGVTSDVPKTGYVQLPSSPVFGEAAGKYVPQNIAEDFTGFQYSNAMVSAYSDLVTAYDRWGLRQAKKQLLTVLNPAVRLGNQMTNRVIFSQLNGINPVQFNVAYANAGKLISENAPVYREAVAQGLTGVDITQAEFFAQRIAGATGEKNIAKKALDWTKTSYSDADDKARIAAYSVYRERGYSPEEAARIVQRGFQDYKSVGFFYDLAAKTPVIGNAFVRFAADSIRIAKNAAIDHPLRTLSTIAIWSAFVNAMSVASHESSAGEQGDSVETKAFNLVTGRHKSDAQKARENRFGAPKLPYTNISMAVQTPWGEVNVARFMPWYQLNDVNDGISKFMPIQQSPVTVNDGHLTVNGAGLADPLLGQLTQIATDKDFRNKSIQDPNNTDNKFRRDPLTTEQKRNNVLRFLFDNNAPVGREIDQTISAIKGQPDIYNKERTVPQAILRDMGIKIEQYGDKQQKDAASIKAYQDEKAQIDAQLEGMSPDAQEAYKRLTGYDKLRKTVTNEFDPTKDRFVKAPVYDFSEDKWKDYAAHPEIYQLMVDKKAHDNATNGTPVQPEFDPRLSESFRKQLIQNKMVAPGDDAELDQRMYSSPEWDYYQKLKDEYTKAAKAYYLKSDTAIKDELVKHQDAKFPEKPDVLKQYSIAYGKYASGTGGKPEFTDAVKAAKEQYNKDTFNWTNNERKARGLSAITWDVWNNPTFGFDSTPSSFGYGNGSYDPSAHVNTLTDLTNFSKGVSRLDPVTAAAMPQLANMFARLQAGSPRAAMTRTKPPIGASSRGQG